MVFQGWTAKLTFIGAQYLSSLRIFFNVLDDIYQVQYFRLGEEWIIVRTPMHLFVVVSRATSI
jgi:hypothetical protein